MTDNNGSEVSKFFAGKSVFITGGTGFLGICLINKLLSSCSDIHAIYLLMRAKKNKDIDARLTDLTKNAIFETLLESNSTDIFQKLHAVTGDVGEENLGLSAEDRKRLTDNVHVVFHSAATLDFAETLKTTVNVNLLGTRRVLDLSKQMSKLEAFVHVSSAYVNSYLLEAKEELYSNSSDPEKIIDIVQSCSDNGLEEITPKILKDHPNTYTFTKHLAEHEVDKCCQLFPCGIVRPSMITAAWKDPVPGWTISKNGPQGFLMGAAKGVVRRLPVASDLVYDYIPVDIVVNQLIVTAYHIATARTKGTLKVFHCTSSTYNPFRWNLISHKINEYLHSYPLKSAVWYPHLKLVNSIFMFKIAAFLFHMVPGMFLDTITKIAGGRPILVRLHTNVNNSLDRLKRFIFTEWKFHNTETLKLHHTLNDVDQVKFNLDIGTLQWESYFIDLTLGVRRYLNNEKAKNLPAARAKDTRLMFLHLLLQGSFFSLLWYIGSLLLGISMTKCAWIVPVSYILFSFL